MRIVLDTNILVSGPLWLGPSNKILKLAENNEPVPKEILSEKISAAKFDTKIPVPFIMMGTSHPAGDRFI